MNTTRRQKTLRAAGAAASLCLIVTVTACGGSSGTTETATAPKDLDQPATGNLRVFAYEDSVTPEMMDPFQEQNPDLKIQTATFDSNSEAAAKLAGGFEADVVEVCLDEAEPLLQRKLCLLYTSPSPRDGLLSRMPSSA